MEEHRHSNPKVTPRVELILEINANYENYKLATEWTGAVVPRTDDLVAIDVAESVTPPVAFVAFGRGGRIINVVLTDIMLDHRCGRRLVSELLRTGWCLTGSNVAASHPSEWDLEEAGR